MNARWKTVVALLSSVLIVTATACGAQRAGGGDASSYPERTPRFVVPYDAGGGVDLFARAFQKAAGNYDFDMRIEYLPGASAVLGTREVLGADPDGYTLLVSSLATNATNPIQSGDFAPTDFDYICALAGIAYVIIVPPDDTRTAEQILQTAVDRPGSLSFASAGALGSDAVGMYSVLDAVGGEMENVPFDSGSEAIAQVAGGHVQIGIASAAPGLEAHKAGLVHAVATTAAEPLPGADGVPTVADVIGEDFEYLAYLGITGPKGMPVAAQDYLKDLCTKVAEDDGFNTEIENQGNNVTNLLGDDFAAYNQELIDTVITPVIESLGTK